MQIIGLCFFQLALPQSMNRNCYNCVEGDKTGQVPSHPPPLGCVLVKILCSESIETHLWLTEAKEESKGRMGEVAHGLGRR